MKKLIGLAALVAASGVAGCGRHKSIMETLRTHLSIKKALLQREPRVSTLPGLPSPQEIDSLV